MPVEDTPAVANAYDTWDNGSACDPAAANRVAEAIKDLIASYLYNHTTVHYLVLVGDDLMLPFYRVPDDSLIANEAI